MSGFDLLLTLGTTYSVQLQVCLSMYDLLVETRHFLYLFLQNNYTVDKLITNSNENEKEYNLNNTKTLTYCFNPTIRHTNIFQK